jgi:hypothetical protein
MTAEQLLDSLFAAISARDLDAVAELYHAEMQAWNNVSRRTVDRAGSLRILRAFLERVTTARYEVLQREHCAGGAMQRPTCSVCSSATPSTSSTSAHED